MRRLASTVIATLLVLLPATAGASAGERTPDHVVPAEAGQAVPLPPRQPRSGGLPHDADYPYPGETASFGLEGLGGFTVYVPRDEVGSVPDGPLPVVVLLRGACVGPCDMDRDNDINHVWREHLVKKGNIVVLPHYQQADEPEFELANVAAALDIAMEVLTDPTYVADHPDLPWESDTDPDGHRQLDGPHPTPDPERTGFAGHSRGSQMAVKLAARIASGEPFAAGTHLDAGRTAAELGLLAPGWLLVLEPGPTSFQDYSDAREIPADTLVAILVGEDDTLAGDSKGIEIWQALSQIPDTNRDFVRVRSDRRGPWTAGPPVAGCEPEQLAAADEDAQFYATIFTCGSNGAAWSRVPKPQGTRNMVNPGAQTGDLTADHYFPGRGDALDVHAVWKLSQGLIECDADTTRCAPALGDTPSQRHMGVWSDGRPVRQLCVTNDPTEPIEVSCTPGSAADGGPLPVVPAGANIADERAAAPAGSRSAQPTIDPGLPATGGGTAVGATALLVLGALVGRRRGPGAATTEVDDR